MAVLWYEEEDGEKELKTRTERVIDRAGRGPSRGWNSQRQGERAEDTHYNLNSDGRKHDSVESGWNDQR